MALRNVMVDIGHMLVVNGLIIRYTQYNTVNAVERKLSAPDRLHLASPEIGPRNLYY